MDEEASSRPNFMSKTACSSNPFTSILRYQGFQRRQAVLSSSPLVHNPHAVSEKGIATSLLFNVCLG